MSNKIFITGATGTIGRALIKSLKNTKASFRAGVRNVKEAREKLGDDVELVEFDFAKPLTFASATAGIDKVFLLGPPLRTDLHELVNPFIDHLEQAGIKRVIYFSALGLDKVKELPFHSNVIKRLRQSQFDITVLEPTFFAQNFKNFEWQNITERGILYAPAGNGKAAFVDVNDIANATAAVLTQSGHSGNTYVLTGPELYSYSEIADILSEITGKGVKYVAPTPQEYTETLRQSGAPDFIAPYMIAVYSLIADGYVNMVSNDIEKLTGNKPTSLKQVIKRDFATQPA